MGQVGFIGEVRMFGGNFAPRGWAFCDGQLLAISSNTALFSILGTIYGGDGRTTFALPDLRGRAPLSSGRGPGLSDYREGAKSGSEQASVSNLQLPSHNHLLTGGITIGSNANAANSNEASGNTLGAGDTIYNSDPADPGEDLGGVSHTLAVGFNGGSQLHNNMQPYLAVHYIIAITGTYPSRN